MSARQEGKHSGSENRQRHPRVYSRVTDAERAKIEMDAAAQGLSVGAYLRWLAIDRPQTRPVRRPLADVALLAKLKGEAGRVDGNLAQLLRLANRGEIVGPDELADAAKAVRDFYVTALETLRRGA